LGGNFNSDWSWEMGANFARSTVNTVARNQIRAADLQAALNGTTRATALNPFGASDNMDVVNRLFTVSNSANEAQVQNYDMKVSGKLFEIDGRNVGIAFGGEMRREKLTSDPDTQSYVGSGGGTPFKGSRQVYSAYVESTIPLLKQVEVQIAGRYENYSDFGTTTKPKIGAKFKALDWLLLRASFSQAFKAPDLGTLYTAQTVSFTSGVVSDPKRPSDPPVQLRNVSGGNPNLKPENSDCYYAGFVVDVPRVKGLELTLDYFKFKLSNLINTPGTTTVLSREDQLPGAVVRDNTQGNPGPILYLQTVPFNVASQEYEGFDVGVAYSIKNTRIGDFYFKTDWTRIMNLKIDYGFGGGMFNNVGLRNNPRWNGNGTLSWRYKDYGAEVSADYFGNYYNDGYTAAGWPEKGVCTYNFGVSYKGFKGIKMSLVLNNAFNTEPPMNGRETSSFDQSTYGWLAAGRTLYVKLSREF
jgi:iron complex outermembrane recepter protein